MRIVGRLEQLNDHHFFWGGVIVKAAGGHSVQAELKYFHDICCFAETEECESFENAWHAADTDDRIPRRVGRLETSGVQNCSGTVAVHVPRTSRGSVRCEGDDTAHLQSD